MTNRQHAELHRAAYRTNEEAATIRELAREMKAEGKPHTFLSDAAKELQDAAISLTKALFYTSDTNPAFRRTPPTEKTRRPTK